MTDVEDGAMTDAWFPAVSYDLIPAVDTHGMIEVDRLMQDELSIGMTRMMELAGHNLAHLVRVRYLGGDPIGKTVVVLAGAGGNGGGALVCARRLVGWGARILLFLAQPAEALRGIAAEQLSILGRLGVRDSPWADDADAVVRARREADAVIDGLIGYGLKSGPRGLARALIDLVGTSPAKVVALDVPSGLDATTGMVPGVAIRAEATMTLALPKTGLYAPRARPYVGDLYLADIGVPPTLYAMAPLGLDVRPFFSQSDILRVIY